MPWKPANEARGAGDDFWDNYNAMRSEARDGADKYFHCKANCEASKRGVVGELVAWGISNGREIYDRFKGDTAQQSACDQEANEWGRDAAPASRVGTSAIGSARTGWTLATAFRR